MNRSTTFTRHGPRLTSLRTVYTVGAVALSLIQPPLASADPRSGIVVPAVPANLEVQAGNRAYVEGHGVGTQNYICMACPNTITPEAKCPASGFAWAFFGPQATLFDVHDGDDHQIITHFNSPNPAEEGQERPTWQDSRGTSIVWGNNTFPPAEMSTDPAFVAEGAIPWLLLPATGSQVGPTGGHKLTKTTFIQRLNTSGGGAPSPDTCAAATDAGKKALVPYSADYFFYRNSN